MATTVTAAESILDVFNMLIETADDGSTPVRDLLESKGRVIDTNSGDAYRWTARNGENASTANISAEGGDYNAAGNATFVPLAISHAVVPLSTTFEITNTLMAFNRGRAEKFDIYEQEFRSALKMHRKKMEDNVIVGLEGGISSTGSYAGQTRSTAGLVSYEAARAAADLDYSDMQTMYLGLRSDPRVADLTSHVIVSNVDSRSQYNDSAVGTGAGDPRVATVQDSVIDAGKLRATSQFNSIPWFEATRMTDEIVLQFDPANVLVDVVRPIEVVELAKTADKTTYVINSQETTVVIDPRQCGKLTAYVP